MSRLDGAGVGAIGCADFGRRDARAFGVGTVAFDLVALSALALSALALSAVSFRALSLGVRTVCLLGVSQCRLRARGDLPTVVIGHPRQRFSSGQDDRRVARRQQVCELLDGSDSDPGIAVLGPGD